MPDIPPRKEAYSRLMKALEVIGREGTAHLEKIKQEKKARGEWWLHENGEPMSDAEIDELQERHRQQKSA